MPATERPQAVQDLYADADHLACGFYMLPNGTALFNLAEVLEAAELEDNEANRLIAKNALMELFAKDGTEVIIQPKENQ